MTLGIMTRLKKLPSAFIEKSSTVEISPHDYINHDVEKECAPCASRVGRWWHEH